MKKNNEKNKRAAAAWLKRKSVRLIALFLTVVMLCTGALSVLIPSAWGMENNDTAEPETAAVQQEGGETPEEPEAGKPDGTEPEEQDPSEQTDAPEAQTKPERSSVRSAIHPIPTVIALAVVVVGGAVYFLKFRNPKPDAKGSADLDEYDYGDEDEPEDDAEESEDA